MNVNKLVTQTIDIAETGVKKLAPAVKDIDVSKEAQTITHGAQEIAGNYGKAISKISSNTVPSNNAEKELSALEKIFDKLENKGRKVIKFDNDADEMEVLLFRGKHNDYIKARDGKIYRIRYSKDDELNKTLVNVAEMYASRGIIVPKMMTVNINGKRGIASQLMTDLLPKETNPKACYKMFGLDVIFGFRNAYSKGTTMLNHEGEVVRISTSGSAGYRVRGEKRPDFTEELTELRTFLDPNVNPESAEFLKDMTREDLLDSIVFSHKNSHGYSCNDLIYKRYNNLKEFWMRATLTPQKEGESLLQYVTRVQDIVKNVHKENVQYSQKLREIIENYPTDGKYTWGESKFTDDDKELCKKFINTIEDANDIPKAIYNRHFSREEMLELAKMQMVEDKTSNSFRKFVELKREPEILSRIIYSPEKTGQITLDELANFSKDYSSKLGYLSPNQPGKRTILEQGLLDKYSKGEISFKELDTLSDIRYDKFDKVNERHLLEPIAGRETPLNPEMIKGLAQMNDEDFEKIIQRTEIFQDMPYRSEPLTSEYLYDILKLNEEEYQRMLRYHLLEDKYPGGTKRLFNDSDIETLAKMSDAELDIAIKRGLLKHIKELEPKDGFGGWNCQLFGSEIKSLAKLPDEQFNNLLERGLLSGKYDCTARDRMLATADLTTHDLEILDIYGIKSDFSYNSWTPEQLKKILTLPAKYRINELEKINPNHPTKTSFGSPEKLLDRDEIIKFAELPEEAYQKAISIMKDEKLMNSLFQNGGVYEASLMNAKEWEVLRKRGLLDVENQRYAHLSDLTYNYINDDIQKLYPNSSGLTLLSKIPDEKWEKFIQHGLISTNPKKGQLIGRDLFAISRFSDEEFEKLLKTKIFDVEYNPDKHHGYGFSGYHSLYELKKIVKDLTTDEIEALAKHNFFTKDIENSHNALYSFLDTQCLKEVAKFTDKQFENLEKLLADKNNYRNEWLALQVAKRFKSDVEIQRILDRGLQYYCTAFNGCDNGIEKLINIAELVKLTDDEWKFTSPLMLDGLGDWRFLGSISRAIVPGKGTAQLVGFVNGRKNIYEFSFRERRTLLNLLTHSGGAEIRLKGLIPEGTIIPKTQYRRQLLINELLESIGIASKKLTEKERKVFFESLSQMASKDSGIMSTNFDMMSTKLADKIPSPRLLYSREKFVRDVYGQIKDLPLTEQKKIFNYFSFDIEKNAQGELVLQGYPDPAGKVSKLGEYEEENTKHIINKLKPIVDKFTNGNKVFVEGNPKLEAELNKIIEVFPEFSTTIGKIQHNTHDFTVDVHTMKVLQGVMSDPRYAKLSDNDKVIIQISTILHDLTKAEKTVDKAHPKESAFDAYYMLKRLNLPREDKLKVYEIIKNHDWLERLNGKVKISEHEYRRLTPEEYNSRLQKIAFEHRQNDCFEMASILAKADLKGVKKDEEFYNRFKDAYDKNVNEVQKLITKIKETSIHIPQTKVPKASDIIIDDKIAQEVTYDGIKNVIINLKPGQDLSKIGFDKGVISDEFNVIVHAFDEEEQATVLRALSIVDSDALLSSSWVNCGKGNYKVFREQGFVLKVDSDDIHAGKYCDFGSGYKKDYETLLSEYIFGNNRADVRKYWSDIIKEKFELSNEDYRKFYESIKNKPFNVIKSENPEIAQKLQEIIDDMDVKRRAGGRNYNEWLISRPEIQAGFFWGRNKAGKPKTIKDVPIFIREYCAENNIPIIFFGE